MKSLHHHRDGACKPAFAWAATAILTLGALLGTSDAMAAPPTNPPPANTFIGNQATASFVDGSGVTQVVTSNLVQTQIQQVGAFTLASNVTKSSAIGNTVYTPHTLTNTGNGTDGFTLAITDNAAAYTFSKIEVFADADLNGIPDSTTALCSITPTAVCNVPAQTVTGNGGTFNFVVAYTVPLGAATGTANTATVVAAPAPSSPVLGSYSPATASNTDTINVTNLAAFSAVKALAVPTVPAPGGGTWPLALASGPRSLATSTCPATYAAAAAPAAGCVYSVYTINYQNTGGAPGAFYMNDILPGGLTYVAGSAVWSSAGGVALSEATGEATAGIDFQQSAQTLSARIANVNPNVTGSISFMVLVNSTAAVGITTTSNTATYDPLTTLHTVSLDGAGASSTNAAAFVVSASYGVVSGSSTGTAGTSVDATPGTPLGTAGTADADQNVVASVTPGGSVRFTHKVFNTGNATDTFNLTVSANTFPAGTTFSLFKADGLTPLLDTNGDGITDSGTLTLGSSTTYIVQANLPTTVAAGAGPFTLTLRATSGNDATKFDASGDQVTIVTGILVDLTGSSAGNGTPGSTGNGDVGAGASPLPTTTNTTPAGTGTIFELFITNNDSIAQTYNPAASQSAIFPGSLPTGWTVKFVALGGGCSAAAMTTTPSVAAGTQLQFEACVTPLASAAPVTTNIYFRVVSAGLASNGTVASDAMTNAVTVTAAATYSATLLPNNNGQVSAGGTVVYGHTLSNTGAQSCGAYTLSTTQSAAASGWTVAVFLDNNNDSQIDPGDTPVTAPIAGPLAAGATQKILVRVFAAGGATPGLQDTVTVTATFTDPAPNCGTTSATDITTVVLGQIRVQKNQALNPAVAGVCPSVPVGLTYSAALLTGAKPGDCVVYEVIATNEGLATVTNVSISDAVPNYTAYSGATQPTTQCTASAGATGSPVYATNGTTVTCGLADTLPPGATLRLNFAVKVNQ